MAPAISEENSASCVLRHTGSVPAGGYGNLARRAAQADWTTSVSVWLRGQHGKTAEHRTRWADKNLDAFSPEDEDDGDKRAIAALSSPQRRGYI